jgi:poly-gamma-glutamate synthase PgsB/CapB
VQISVSNLSIIIGLGTLLLLLGLAEGLRHRRNIARIPIRIHVNGTRGKSSVVRLIAGGLRAGGIVTCAKTTGTAATMILPDGSEFRIYRPAGANIIEQIRSVDTAAEAGAQALVVECMALQPLLQGLSELRLVRSTHGVITNVRADHLDIMGPDERDVGYALASTTPVAGKMFTSTEHYVELLSEAAADRGSEFVALGPADFESVSLEDLAGFSYLEHASNVALALRVCSEFGIDRATALAGMQQARPDPGALTIHEIDFFGRKLFFANALAANDPRSTESIWRSVLGWLPDVERRIALFNCRIDRPDRSRQLGEACVDWPPADVYVVMGSGTHIFARAATARGLDVGKLVLAEQEEPSEIFERLLEHAGATTLITGMGNVHGGGADLARLFRNRGIQKDLRAWT